jgi:D-inositol-3-phosphate glycosyltransferase
MKAPRGRKERSETKFSSQPELALICFSSSFGGLELTTIRLAQDFNHRSARAFVIAPEGAPLAEEAARLGIQVEFLKPGLKYGDMFASWKLSRILRARNAGIALLMQSRDINIAAAAKLAYPDVKLVYYQQMQSAIDKRDRLHTWMYLKLSLWVTLTEQMKRDVLIYTRVPERLVKVAPLGRDTRMFDPSKHNRSAAKRRFNLPSGRPVIAMLGRLDPLKGQEEFIRSMPTVLAHRPDALFVIAGDETKGGKGGYKEVLLGLANEIGVAGNVVFQPFTANVAEFLAAIDIFVLPSHGETYGLVLIEAMAMNKPVIATRAGGVPEIVENGHDGILVPPRDHEALSEAVVRLLKDAPLRRALARRARETAVRRFDSGRCADQLVVLLDAL